MRPNLHNKTSLRVRRSGPQRRFGIPARRQDGSDHLAPERNGTAPERNGTAPEPEATVPGPFAQPIDHDVLRNREAGGPLDHAHYTCQCGYVFEASVSTTVACPHCGRQQAW